MQRLVPMSNDLNNPDERDQKRRIFGTTNPPNHHADSAQPTAEPTNTMTSVPKPDGEMFASSERGGGTILICKKCGCLVPVCESRIDLLIRRAGLDQRPKGRFYFTSEFCFMCSEDAAIFVPPVELVRVPNDSKSPNQL